MSNRRVLIIDDEEGVRTSLALILEDEGYQARGAPNAEAALELVRDVEFDVVLCDVRMPRRDGLDLLPDLIRLQPEATILMMSAYGDMDQAIQAVREGAYDYLAKPFQSQELLLTIRKAEERERLKRENRRLRRELGEGRASKALVAVSPAMKDVVRLIERAAEYKTTVLITGESGVGKEIVARAIHELSERASYPFLAVNCGAIPETLIESELFGHARGAFTGAESAKHGLFREAEGGILFLDEVGELPPPIQVKLLRVLQEEEVRPLGEPKAISVDVRILAATARDLEAEIATGRFRDDLYYRLNVLRIHIPPLRERTEDVPTLADELLAGLARRMGRSVRRMDRDVIEALRSHCWPGNVRELENTLERALIFSKGDRLTLDVFPFANKTDVAVPLAPTEPPSAEPDELSIKRQTRQLEERLIRSALQCTQGNRTRAASILEISPRALQYKIKEYQIEPLNRATPPTDTE
jgi:two-component system response regulator AtoC